MRTVSRFPAALVTTKLMQTFRTSEASLHPLSFLSPLLRSTDVNVISVLLQALVALPVQTWAGGLVTNGSDEDPHKTGQKESLMVEKQSSILTPSPVGEIAEAELFGDEVEQEVWQTPAQTDAPLNEEMILPALFSETEVGIIVGLLRSRDENIRKMTLSLLASSDPSPDGVVNQYLNQLLTAASLSRSPETETAEEMIRRTSLVCQALQVAEVLSGNNGTTYATSVADIILRTDNQQTHKVALGSPTLSNRSRTSADTKSSGKGRGGTMEKAIEMVLTRARKTPTFFSQFSGQIIQTILNQRVDDRISITFLVISAAVVCEEEEITRDEAGQLLYRFNGYLLLTTASIQETLFLVMLRLLACLESAPEAVVNTINELKYRSGRHIQQVPGNV
ncbi:hypothetical protein M408DRAFT_85359 [Serendipita vermifera MAFF 305830]|uniref:Uncharacterized protein n=1 Tax=Serendipita vermifera MAFF 305830 TaxID=933852 RepID=A0A0C3BAF5_SERVB|nr:hypothetical protein M408DRAFT_85359 [Serendipita vermifera MAFF 305830]